MPLELPSNVTQARDVATQATAGAGELAAYQPKVEDVLKQRALDAYNANQDLIPQLDVATQGYIEAPKVGRETYQNIFNPFSREKLVSQYVGQQSLPMLALGSVLGQRFGRVEDIIGAGGRAYSAAAAAEQAKAAQAQQQYENLFNEYVTMEQLRQAERELAMKEAEAAGGGGGGGGGGGISPEQKINEILGMFKDPYEIVEEEPAPEVGLQQLIQQFPYGESVRQGMLGGFKGDPGGIISGAKSVLGGITWPWERGPGQQWL